MDRLGYYREGERSSGWRNSLLFRDKPTKFKEEGPSSLTSVASSRAYQAYTKYETSKDKDRVKERDGRRGNQKIEYDTTGPNDHRYYIDKSEMPSVEEDMLLKLLHQDLRGYSGQLSPYQQQLSPVQQKLSPVQQKLTSLREDPNKKLDKGGDSGSSGFGTRSSQSSPSTSKSSGSLTKEQQKISLEECSKCGSLQYPRNSKPSQIYQQRRPADNRGKKFTSMVDLNTKEDFKDSRIGRRRLEGVSSMNLSPNSASHYPVIPDPDYDLETDGDQGEKVNYSSDCSKDYSLPWDSVSPTAPRRRGSSMGPQDHRGSSMGPQDHRGSSMGPQDHLGSPMGPKDPKIDRKQREQTPKKDARKVSRETPDREIAPFIKDTRHKATERRSSSSSNVAKNVWSNANRYRGGRDQDDLIPTKTLKEALKTRPSVSEFVKEITRASKEDRRRELERKKKEREEEYEEETNEIREDEESKKIYKEILEVVSLNSPDSIQTIKGRMVGYEEDKKKKKSRKESLKGKSSHNLSRIRLSEDRESISTSLDSYPFAPTSPWNHGVPSRYNRFGYPVFPEKEFGLPSPTGPVSFAGISPTKPVGLTGRDLPSPGHGSLSVINQRKPKKKGFWKYFF